MSRIIPWLPIIQLAVSLLLIISVLLQARGSGIGDAFGGSSAVYRTRRGIEKTLFRGTILLGILFAGISLARILVS
jgi:preprotein translocase subunit SecG